MRNLRVGYGDTDVELKVPAGIGVRVVTSRAEIPEREPLAVVAGAVDQPIDAPRLEEVAAGASGVTIVVPDGTRPPAARVYLLPVLARLARAGVNPDQLKVVMARGIHPATRRAAVEAALGAEVMTLLRPVQSAPDTPAMNALVGTDPELGEVRVHRLVAEADLVVLTGIVMPHHLAGFGGGPKSFVPGVADRATAVAAHRLTLDALVRPDGSIRSAEGRLEGNAFHAALLRAVRLFGRAWLLNVVLGPDGAIAGAAAGEVDAAQRAAIDQWREIHAPPPPEPADLVVVGVGGAQARDLIQAHKYLLRALPWAKPGAPIVWMARAGSGGGHPALLPWFASGKLPRHLAALRKDFHPYGLTAYSMRRIAQDHAVHVVSEMGRDLLRPMGFLPFKKAQAALDFALKEHEVRTCAVLP